VRAGGSSIVVCRSGKAVKKPDVNCSKASIPWIGGSPEKWVTQLLGPLPDNLNYIR
jgi:hypothetical protein